MKIIHRQKKVITLQAKKMGDGQYSYEFLNTSRRGMNYYIIDEDNTMFFFFADDGTNI